MQHIAADCRLFHQIAVAPGKGVGVQDNRAHTSPLCPSACQSAQILRKAIPSVLHKHQAARHLNDGVKAQVSQLPGCLRLGIDKHMVDAVVKQILHQPAHHPGHQALPLARLIHRQAAQGVGKGGACRHQQPCLVIQAQSAVQVLVQQQAFLLQQRPDLRHPLQV